MPKDKIECKCDGCEKRFVCWTTKRIFSDPTSQALYEAHVAEGLSHKDALREVKEALEDAIRAAQRTEVWGKANNGKDEWWEGGISGKSDKR